MLKKIILIIFLSFGLKANAQWNFFTGMSTFVNMNWNPIYGTFDDAIFISHTNGMYSLRWLGNISSNAIYVKATTNTAQSWTTVFSQYPPQGYFVNSLGLYARKNQNTFYHVWYNDPIINIDKSINNGGVWTLVGGIGADFLDFSAPDTAVNYLLYQEYATQHNRYIQKYNHGTLINKLDTFQFIKPQMLFFSDTVNGYIVASTDSINKKHIILKSSTGGTNWSTVFTDTTVNLRKIYFTNVNTGYAVGDSGKTIKTSDGGATWQFQNSNITVKLNCVNFINDSVGFAVGDSGVIIRTVNGGINWMRDSTGVISAFQKVFFVNDSIAFALTGNLLYERNVNATVGVWEVYNKQEKDLNIYPNPSAGKCIIRVPDEFLHEQNLNLSVFDNTGKLIQQKKLAMNDGKIKLNLEGAAKGIYNVTLRNGVKIYSGKIVLE